uniref:Zinc finger CCCH domain-containing protein 6 n=1 Tax=Knipowitschia caucasica TaxID=637954 RepID=A0AAV2JNF8_KNICA
MNPPGMDPNRAFMPNVPNMQQRLNAEPQFQALPPPVQKAILMHLQQQDGNQKGPEPQVAPPKDDGGRDETTNWYSSDDGDEGSVTSILKSLKKQSEKMKQAQAKPAPPPSGPVADPRLKERGPPSDPRIKMDPRQRPAEVKKETDASGNPRLSRDPRKVREQYQQPQQTVNQKPATGDDDDEGERELRDRAVLIPLDPGPGVTLRDPRCQLKQFSHIKVDILLQRPVFAETVVWAPEDLIPSLVPKQEHSINLPLPPLIANAQMNRSSRPESPPAPSLPHVDPRMAAARLKTRMPPGSAESRLPVERPADPRQAKSLDPRLKRTSSLDSKTLGQKEQTSSAASVVDPRLQKSNVITLCQALSPKSEPDKLPPYAPRLASSGGGLESPTTILGGISLYDPRNQTEQKEQADPPKKTGILKNPVKKDSTPPLSLSPTQRSFEEVKSTETTSEKSPPPSVDTPPQSSPVKPAAVHNLPIQALAGLIRPQYTDPRQAKQVGQGTVAAPEETEQKKEGEEEKKEVQTEEEAMEVDQDKQDSGEAEDRTLKDVFKTFDPTASPFCQ